MIFAISNQPQQSTLIELIRSSTENPFLANQICQTTTTILALFSTSILKALTKTEKKTNWFKWMINSKPNHLKIPLQTLVEQTQEKNKWLDSSSKQPQITHKESYKIAFIPLLISRSFVAKWSKNNPQIKIWIFDGSLALRNSDRALERTLLATPFASTCNNKL